MRNLLAFIGLLVVGFAILGWYMNWYKLSFSRNDNGNLQIKTDVDTNKVGSDTSDAFKTLATVVNNQADKAANGTNPPAGAPGSTPGPVNSTPGSGLNLFAPTMQESNKPTPPTTPTRQPIQLLPPK